MGSKFRFVLPLAFVAVLVGCASDPSQLTDGRGIDARRSQDGTDPAPAGAEAEPGKPRGASDAGAPVDAGATDARADADAAVAGTAFTGAGAYVVTTGPLARKDAHNFAGNTPPTSPAKQACLGCHVTGGIAPAFAFGGTAFTDALGNVPAVGIEIRVRAADGSTLSAYTDGDGNFYQPVPIAFPASVGARNAAGTRLMTGPPPDGNCNNTQCHGGAHPWINIP